MITTIQSNGALCSEPVVTANGTHAVGGCLRPHLLDRMTMADVVAIRTVGSDSASPAKASGMATANEAPYHREIRRRNVRKRAGSCSAMAVVLARVDATNGR